MVAAASLLAAFEEQKSRFGEGLAGSKCTLLRALARRSMRSAKDVVRLHEALCFLHAYPDDEQVLRLVRDMLDQFDRRSDFRRHRQALADSGIAGATIRYPFFPSTAHWLSRRFPGALKVIWKGYAQEDLLLQRLPLLATWTETPALDDIDWPAREWVRRLAGDNTSDADFLIHRCAQVGANEAESEAFYQELELELELSPVPGSPSISRARLEGRPVYYQQTPLRRERPELKTALKQTAIEIVCDEAEGERIITLAREAMVLRHRDLDAFAYADPKDVRLYDCGDGLQFAALGVVPARRLLLESVYAYLTLKNGVPIGYVLTSAFFQSSEIAYNVFDTWRGGEAGYIYGRVLALTRQIFGTDTFTIYPYQLGGEGNAEGLKSGSWWFYQKLGFRARDPEVLQLMKRELAAQKRNRSYRTPIAKLKTLSAHNVYWSVGKERDDVIGLFDLAHVGLVVTDFLARRFGADREHGEAVCAEEAATLCAVPDWETWDAGEQLAWRRWSPLMLLLPGVTKWSAEDRAALVAVVRAKGGRRESDYVRLLDRHKRLRAALRRL